jgi:thymidine kinase
MFLEEKVRSAGWIEVITGSMFSGKTEELIRRIRRAKIAQQKTMIFKPKVDTRYSEIKIVSHDAKEIDSTPVDKAEDILYMAENYEVIGIDEAQFFGSILVEVCNRLADKGIRVVVAGLDMDFAGKPFGPIPRLLAIAEYVTKVHAICMRCGNLAQYSHRLSDSEQLFLLGEKGIYEPLCRSCYNKANIKKQTNNIL